ncbi:MAG: NAD-dependent epimerase/dehydratase family protein [Deltaproteobacteria bacterium]|nr:NAD-dependent epimerase/dehydratase family protein [Deltaproteobacteria bacterium]
MKVLLTGGTGFLGNALWPLLVERGHTVKLLQRSTSKEAKKAGVEIIQASLTDRDALKPALKGVDVLYHLAGRVSWDPKDARDMYALHVDATRGLLEEAHAAKVKRVVLASTSGTIGVSKEERVATEEDPYSIDVVGRWPYYASKIFEERLALEYCKAKQLPLIVLNPSLLLGPGDERLSSTTEVLAFMNREIPAVPQGGLSFVDVRDCADAFANALEKGEPGERYLLGAANMTLREFFDRLARITGIPAPKLGLPSKLNRLGAFAWDRWSEMRKTKPAVTPQAIEMGDHYFYIDSSKARRELGFAPRDPQETLAATVAYIKQTMPHRKEWSPLEVR